MPIYRGKHKSSFTQISNACLHDDRLSYKARGLLSYMLSMPDDWEFYTEELQRHSTDGIKSVRSAIKELIALGYIRQVRNRANGRLSGQVWYVYEEPRTQNGNVITSPQVLNGNVVETASHQQLDKQNADTQAISQRTQNGNVVETPLEQYSDDKNPVMLPFPPQVPNGHVVETASNQSSRNGIADTPAIPPRSHFVDVPEGTLLRTNSTKRDLNTNIDVDVVKLTSSIKNHWLNQYGQYANLSLPRTKALKEWLKAQTDAGTSPDDILKMFDLGVELLQVNNPDNPVAYLNSILSQWTGAGYRSKAEIQAHEEQRSHDKSSDGLGVYDQPDTKTGPIEISDEDLPF